MFAIIQTGGKQYKVAKDNVLYVEKLDGKVGDKLALENVLLVSDGSKVQVGSPTVSGVRVEAEILDQKKSEKVLVFKKKRRHNYRRKKGHRQEMTVLKISDIVSGGAKKAAAPKKEAAPKAKTEAKTTKTAEKKAPAAKKTTAAKKPAAKKTTAKKAAPKKKDS